MAANDLGEEEGTMQKIGFVIPWCGENEPGGIEQELRTLTSHLQFAGVEVEVLTTCVRDFRGDWNRNYYAAGTAVVEDIQVRRFPVHRRDASAYERVQRKLLQEGRLSLAEERTYIEEGINSPQLYEYLRSAADEYALYVFLPYCFGTTYFGMQVCPEQSVLLPCFRDEPSLYLRLFRQEYVHARGMIYHAPPEMELAGRVYDFSTTQQICIGCGMETQIEADAAQFRRSYHITDPFLLYVGRKDAEKNVPLLLRYFAELKRRQQTPLKLVLIGDGTAEIPVSIREDVYDLGYVSQADKYHAMAAAAMLCQPSRQERFAVAMMESWLCGTPALVYAHCPVTRDFARRSNGGLYFQDYFEFEGSVLYLLSHPDIAKQLGENGRAFVQERFSWDTIIEQYRSFFREAGKGVRT